MGLRFRGARLEIPEVETVRLKKTFYGLYNPFKIAKSEIQKVGSEQVLPEQPTPGRQLELQLQIAVLI